MKIQSSDVLLTSQHLAVQTYSKSESLATWIGTQRPDFESRTSNGKTSSPDSVALSDKSRAAMQAWLKSIQSAQANVASSGQAVGNDKSAAAQISDLNKAVENDPRSMLIRLMVEALTGKKIHLTSMADVSVDTGTSAPLDPNQAANQAPSQSQAPAPPPPPSTGYGLEYDSRVTYSETEDTNFSAQGVVKTSDGQQINFNLQLSMQRSYTSEENVSIRLGDAVQQKKDPLTINFGGTAAQLTSTKFSFDLNNDGNAEQISFVAPNSGFIALDKNNDGKINNGSELFGAKTGDGFKELAAYDQDKNGWIDENDAVFSQLKVWSKDAQGNDSLVGLKQAGVGAFYLGKTATPFELKNGANDSLGAVKSSGVYLNENGSAGTLQQVDLTI
jgi:hypothetical protein